MMVKTNNNEFLKSVLIQIPRLLGQLNRNPSSKSYGSFDRAYWHYRTNDISCARYQEAVYTLSLLYTSNFEGNIYHKDEKVLEWIRASLRFTISLQKQSGSFDEWYINEGSYVGTAFVTAAIGQATLLFRKSDVEIPEEKSICELLEKAAHFLIKSKEETVLNQVSGAIFAIACAGCLLSRDDLAVSADKLLEEFLSKQNPEGWWNEYGGPDIGYLTLTISYLEKYQRLTGSKKVSSAIAKAKSFVESFINPDYTAGGEHMSRNTEYIIPSSTLPYLGTLRPTHLDDRYLSYILYNWIETGLCVKPEGIKISYGESYFSESSLLRVANDKYFLVANGKKGGSFRLYAGGKVYYDSGLESKGLSTGILNASNEVDYKSGHLKTIGLMKKIKEPVLDTKLAIIFKLWQLLFGRITFLQKLVKKFLRLRMINYSGESKVSFKRIIEYHSGKVVITDSVYGATMKKDDIIFGVKASYSAVPSSKYAGIPEVCGDLFLPDVEEKVEDGIYTIKRIFNV